ncbi:unnamed protein product [Triticum turgidum subsp. durum]|uniref:Uncharacterized protein n=1 Tax=Triticum turgidum subsp. durum TaxID=4567 RepID=A0A9R0SIJ2_TRITD|nr:unnamed protein product [Triticum turgidum subsp. durum]
MGIGMEPRGVAACGTVAFSWEQEPGVSKESPKEAEARTHQLRVPPPPGGPGAPSLSPPARSRSSKRGVRPEEDPFLAAYVACTASGRKTGRGHNEAQKMLGWAGLRFALGLGLSCKTSCGVAEESVVRLAKKP